MLAREVADACACVLVRVRACRRAKGRLQARVTRLKKVRLMSNLTTMIEGLQ